MKYIIETRTEKEWQKVLNQWKHEYELDIVKAIPREESKLTLILIRW